MKDDLAARRAAKGIMTIKIGAGSHSLVRHVKLDAGDMIDPLATIKARAPRKRQRPPHNS